jgi:peptide-N4-(N-acetyl-beta-glucosaminyl)asparagine amidase
MKAIHLVQWFKHDFMHWVDPIKCPACSGDTRHQSSFGHEGMTEEERRVAGRVEVWKCVDDGCGGVDRFLRLK